MSETIQAARINRTGAYIRLHGGNRSILNNKGVVEVTVKPDEDGKLVEVGGTEHVNVVAASKDLHRIGEALVANETQRQILLDSAFKLKGAFEYLQQLGVCGPDEDAQSLNVNTLEPSKPKVTVEDVSDELAKDNAKKKAQAKKAKSSNNTDPDLTDL